MYIRCSLLFIVLTISWLGRAGSHTIASNHLLLDQLTKLCSIDGIPVCGIRDKQLVLFSNGCLLNEANKDVVQSEKIVRKVPLQYCMNGCQFSCPNTYEPVCARNIKTYQKQLFRNQCELMKYACITNMDYLKISIYECSPKSYSENLNKLLEKRSRASKEWGRPISCINVFKPVCGSYMGVKSSFQNECLLNAENVDYNRDWRIVNYGLCPEDYSKDHRRKDKPTMRHLIKKRSYHNNVYNQVEYNGNNFLGNKNELNVAPNDLFVYMPPTFQTQYLNHDTTSYQHKTYDEIWNKIATFSPADMSFPVEEDKKVIETPISEPSTISPMSYGMNRMNLNYYSDQNLANGIKRQSIAPVIESFNGENKNEYYYAFAHVDPSIETEGTEEIAPTAFQIPETIPVTTTSQQNSNQQKQEEVKDKNIECKFGSVAICAALADGTIRTFETICEMMTANVYFKKTWTKLHDGCCETCKNNCSREYEPVCVSRNGANYTMVNECYYNMAICMDKQSKWQKLSNNECERYTRIPDKYANSKPGFPYTSNYFVSETTAMPSTDSALPAITSTTKSLKLKSSKSKKRRPNFKRAISFHETTEEPSTTESHIMSLVKDRR